MAVKVTLITLKPSLSMLSPTETGYATTVGPSFLHKVWRSRFLKCREMPTAVQGQDQDHVTDVV